MVCSSQFMNQNQNEPEIPTSIYDLEQWWISPEQVAYRIEVNERYKGVPIDIASAEA
jgi:hypothetical protein